MLSGLVRFCSVEDPLALSHHDRPGGRAGAEVLPGRLALNRSAELRAMVGERVHASTGAESDTSGASLGCAVDHDDDDDA